jgi:predicted aspartyl protease
MPVQGRPRPWWRVQGGKASLAAGGIFFLTASAQAACETTQLADLPLTIAAGKLFIPATLNQAQESFILDTGASTTAISSDAAGRLSIPHDFDTAIHVSGVGGASSTLLIAQVDKLVLGRAGFAHQTWPIIDMTAVTSGATAPAGLIGADVLRQFDVSIDVPAQRFALWRIAGCYGPPPPWPDAPPPVSVELNPAGHIVVPLTVGMATVPAILDTGAASFVMSLDAAYRAGVSDSALNADRRIEGVGVNDRRWTGHVHWFSSVEFGASRFTHVPAAIVPSAYALKNDSLAGAGALIGLSLLAHSRVWISYPTHTLYIGPQR